jgi:hypothetical protein
VTSARSAVENGEQRSKCIFGFVRWHPHIPCIRGLFHNVMWTAPSTAEIILKASSQWLSNISFKQRTFFLKISPFRSSGFYFGWVSWNIKRQSKNLSQGWMPSLPKLLSSMEGLQLYALLRYRLVDFTKKARDWMLGDFRLRLFQSYLVPVLKATQTWPDWNSNCSIPMCSNTTITCIFFRHTSTYLHALY